MSNIKFKKIVELVSLLTKRNVQVVAVTKHRSLEVTREVILAGAQVVGENRIEEAFEKFINQGLKHEFPEVSVHMIGHLQSRKVKKAVRIFDFLIEVNISGEEQKYGMKIDAVDEIVKEIIKLPNIRLKGLMAMAPYTSDEKIQRETFAGLRKLSEKLGEKFETEYFQVLSMGMSNDYKVAIDEGANMVRIGTALF